MNDNIYDRLGVPRVINGMSWVTTLGGSIMPPEVVQAMVQAVPHYVDMEVLNRKAGEIIARITGAEAGMVTAGAAAGQVAMVAACIAGKDATIVERLPDTTGLRNEIVILRCHRNHYDRCFLIPGARFVEIGKATTAYEWELEAAIDDNTAAVAYVLGPFRKYPLSLEQVVKIAHDRDVPVIVDAAAMVPPAMNLKKYVALGADMVVFSGGKGIRGPQSTGILCGRKGLVEAAAVNFLNFPGRYYAGVGRPMKVSKEQIVALITALELFERTDHDAEWAVWRSQSQVIVDALQGIAGLAVCLEEDENRQGSQAVVYFESSWKGQSGERVQDALKKGDPPIYIGRGGYRNELYVAPVCLQKGEEEIVARRLKEELLGS